MPVTSAPPVRSRRQPRSTHLLGGIAADPPPVHSASRHARRTGREAGFVWRDRPVTISQSKAFRDAFSLQSPLSVREPSLNNATRPPLLALDNTLVIGFVLDKQV